MIEFMLVACPAHILSHWPLLPEYDCVLGGTMPYVGLNVNESVLSRIKISWLEDSKLQVAKFAAPSLAAF